MNEDRKKKMLESLAGFVERVANNVNASPAELTAMPEIAKLLLERTVNEVT